MPRRPHLIESATFGNMLIGSLRNLTDNSEHCYLSDTQLVTAADIKKRKKVLK